MITENDILEPLKVYNSSIKDAHHKNAEEFFDEMVKKANIDIGANKATNDTRKEEVTNRDSLENKLKNAKSKKGWLIFLTIFLPIIGVVLLCVSIAGTLHLAIGITALVLAIAGLVLLLVFPIRSMKTQIKELETKINESNNKIAQLEKEGYEQLSILNSLFEWNMPAKLISTTVPLIQMDQTFNPERFEYLNEKYGFGENTDPDVSSVYVQSGTILGNPFLIERNYVTHMSSKTYTGTLVIHWTTTSTDSEGHTHTQHHTQTLVAHVTKPCPIYYLDTWLIYGNEAAPRLSFSRTPTDVNKMDENKIAKFVKSYEKKLDQMSEKAIKDNKTFTRMANTEFEALFQAFDRDNETEFRLLFTPLGMKNMISLLKSKEPYGDDFIFLKRKCLNYIKSDHSQGINLDGNPNSFYHFDLEEAKNIFVNECDEYMKSLFFDLAPLLSIPLYQQHKDFNYIYKRKYHANITSYETEVLANSFSRKLFLNEDSKTDGILKCEFVKKDGKADIVNIHSYSYDIIKRVEMVPTMGGDGHMHMVPVPWDEYIPLENNTPFVVSDTNSDLNNFRNNRQNEKFDKFSNEYIYNNDMKYQRGLISFIPNIDNFEQFKGRELDKLFGKKED